MMESALFGSPRAHNLTSTGRATAKFHPNIWGDRFLSYVEDDEALFEWREKAYALKKDVLRRLKEEEKRNAKLSLIDAIQRLGVAYHFEDEIDKELSYTFTSFRDGIHSKDDDLRVVALRFRLLREHGYNLACDVFKKFMDNKGNFDNALSYDVEGLLNLYEVANLRVEGETVLDMALNFTKTSLQNLMPQLSPHIAKQVSDALYRPLRKRLPRIEARSYFSIYEQSEKHSEALLLFAKLDFNILQKLHQKELSVISKWWKDIDCPRNFPFARDRIVEGYFWILGVYFEPQYTMARIFLTKVIAMSSIIDDIYDAYGTMDELRLFTDAVERWDVGAIVDLPEYMKPCYEQLLDVFSSTEEEMTKLGKSSHGVECAKEAMKRLLKGYTEERKWMEAQYIPSMEEYMKVASLTSGYALLAIASVVWMDDDFDEKIFKWILDCPKILRASSDVCRLMDDIVSYKFERERRHPPSAIACYTTQHGVSEEEACALFRVQVKEAWKDMNEGFLRPTMVPMPVLTRILNLARVVELTHKESDGYTHVSVVVKEHITSLLCNALEV